VKPLANTNTNDSQRIVSTKELAEILGLSDRRVRQLENEGSLVKIGRGKFDLAASIQKYIDTIKERSLSDDEIDLNKEKTLLTRANRMMAEMELKIIQGEVHRSEDIEKVMNDMLSSFRAQLLVIPGKAAPRLIDQTEIEPIKAILKNYIFEALQELSEYDPTVFYDKSKSKIIIEDKSSEKNSIDKKGPKKNGNRKQTNK
jgi:phage terminase Nu1 subunit (DNA packaging protein)